MKKFDMRSSNQNLQKHIKRVKSMIETAITHSCINNKKFKNGVEAKNSLIRSQKLILQIHEFVKEEFEFYGINKNNIYPHIGKRSPEIKMTGIFKQKNQDVCIVPSRIPSKKSLINWGILQNSGKYTDYGEFKEERILATNVRSQLSSLEKNMDTLFERMIAEATNLHYKYPNLVLGELYMIPVYEYDNEKMKENKVRFKKKHTPIEEYIKFFSYLNNYSNKNDPYKYTKAGLILVDFNKKDPKIYNKTSELIKDKLVNKNFTIELNDLSPIKYAYDLLKIYDSKWGIDLLN